MIITVTLNPAIDKTAQVDTLQVNGLNRLENSIMDVGGKGINVSKAIKELGGTSLVMGFVAGSNGHWIEDELQNTGFSSKFQFVPGNTRVNLKVLDQKMNLTELNEAGNAISEEALKTFTDTLLSTIKKEDIVVLSGSVPPNVPKDIYATLTRKIKEKGTKVILDADGELFIKGIEASPSVIKPNKFELCKYFNISEDISDVELISYTKKLLLKGIEMIALSMGSKGAIFITRDEVAKVPGLKIKAHSSVGAGDSMVGALAYGMEENLELIPLIKLAVATSAGAVMTKGTKAPNREIVESLIKKVEIEF